MKLNIHCFFMDDKQEGEYKKWYKNGQLKLYQLYKDDKLEREYIL